MMASPDPQGITQQQEDVDVQAIVVIWITEWKFGFCHKQDAMIV